MSLRAARSRAFSSIDAEKSMPVTAAPRIQRQVDAGADADLEHAVAPLMSIRWMACSRPGCSVGPKMRS